MVYAPGHFQQTSRQGGRRRYRSQRERIAVRAMAAIALMLLGLVLYSLTNHQRQTANGCIDFNYTTMIGGAEMYKCGSAARTVCATPAGGASIDTDFQTSLYAACRKAGLPVGGLHSAASHR
jgi:hypothetical protein